jgi:cysteine dioxygenase
MTTCSILDLEARLTSEFQRDPKGARVAQILGEYARSPDDWSRYALFGGSGYTRNLIARSEDFELLLLCWNPGQKSPIHNHAGQSCWMAVLEGEIGETQYSVPRPGHSGPLTEGGTKSLVPGKVAFINDEIALHLIRPLNGLRGASLHLYSRPIETCNLYDEQTGSIVTRKMSYDSIRGQRVAARMS